MSTSNDDAAVPIDARTTRTCRLWVDDLLHARFLEGAEVTVEDARENVAVSRELTGGVARPAVIDLRPVRSQTPEARSIFAGREGATVANAVALVVGSPLTRVLGSFYLGFNRPEVPTRLFTSPADATAWLRSLTQ